MRYLNKIVFLNSAHIPYSEIQLDGNVHFIGTHHVFLDWLPVTTERCWLYLMPVMI